MTHGINWKKNFEKEFLRGVKARDEDNEGMARVCARRAAGIVVRAYLSAKGETVAGGSVFNYLKMLYESENEPEAVRQIARHFTLRITPDHVLPEDVDLLADVRWLRDTLFPD